MVWTLQIMIQCWFYNVVDMIYVYFAGEQMILYAFRFFTASFPIQIANAAFYHCCSAYFCFVFVVLFMIVVVLVAGVLTNC